MSSPATAPTISATGSTTSTQITGVEDVDGQTRLSHAIYANAEFEMKPTGGPQTVEIELELDGILPERIEIEVWPRLSGPNPRPSRPFAFSVHRRGWKPKASPAGDLITITLECEIIIGDGDEDLMISGLDMVLNEVDRLPDAH